MAIGGQALRAAGDICAQQQPQPLQHKHHCRLSPYLYTHIPTQNTQPTLGSFGHVVLAKDEATGQLVAIKQMVRAAFCVLWGGARPCFGSKSGGRRSRTAHIQKTHARSISAKNTIKPSFEPQPQTNNQRPAST
jgi:hypothetical protein